MWRVESINTLHAVLKQKCFVCFFFPPETDTVSFKYMYFCKVNCSKGVNQPDLEELDKRMTKPFKECQLLGVFIWELLWIRIKYLQPLGLWCSKRYVAILPEWSWIIHPDPDLEESWSTTPLFLFTRESLAIVFYLGHVEMTELSKKLLNIIITLSEHNL